MPYEPQPFATPTDTILHDCANNFQEGIANMNALLVSMDKTNARLKYYSGYMQTQTMLGVNKGESMPVLERQKLKDDIFNIIKETDTYVASGKTHNNLQALKKLAKDLLSVNSLSKEVEILQAIVGLMNAIKKDTTYALSGMQNLLSETTKLKKFI